MWEIFCPLCHLRISNWKDVLGKTRIKEGRLVHENCIEEFYLKYGRNASAETLLCNKIRGER